jgi:hypothetical protein
MVPNQYTLVKKFANMLPLLSICWFFKFDAVDSVNIQIISCFVSFFILCTRTVGNYILSKGINSIDATLNPPLTFCGQEK